MLIDGKVYSAGKLNTCPFILTIIALSYLSVTFGYYVIFQCHSGDLRQGSSNNSIANFVPGFS